VIAGGWTGRRGWDRGAIPATRRVGLGTPGWFAAGPVAAGSLAWGDVAQPVCGILPNSM